MCDCTLDFQIPYFSAARRQKFIDEPRYIRLALTVPLVNNLKSVVAPTGDRRALRPPIPTLKGRTDVRDAGTPPRAFDLEAATRALEADQAPHRRDLIVVDGMCVTAAFLAAVFLSYGGYADSFSIWQWGALVLAPAALWAPVAVYGRAYAWYERRFLHDELAALFQILVVHFAFVTVLYYNSGVVEVKRSFILVAYALLTGLVGGVRLYFRNRVNEFIRPFDYVIVGGLARETDMLRSGFEYAFHGKAKLLGRFGREAVPDVAPLGDFADLRPFLLSTHSVKKLVFVDSDLRPDEEAEIVDICERRFIDLEVLPRGTALLPRGYKMQHHGSTPLLTQVEEPLSRLSNKALKRALDLAVSGAVVLLVLPWLVPLVGLLIKLDSPGPVFFRQRRSGYLNQPFSMLKFRTMTVNDASDTAQATRGDARVTRVGRWLRRTSLDEFPQFWNAFVGEMSVVGPRPHMLRHTEEYARLIEVYLVRHKVKPGITGWAQVNGLRGPTETVDLMRRRVQADVWYLQNWSIWLDLRVIAQTVYNAVRGEENAV